MGKVEPWALVRSKAKLLTEHRDKITFKDVAGIDEAKDELEEIVEVLRNLKNLVGWVEKFQKGPF